MLRIILLSAGLAGSFLAGLATASTSQGMSTGGPSELSTADDAAEPGLADTRLADTGPDSPGQAEAGSGTSGSGKPESVKSGPARPDVAGTEAAPAGAGQADVWQRIRQSDSITVKDTPAVAAYRERYTREAHWISKTMHRGRSVLSMLVDKLDARDMPLELALLPAVESSFEPNAISVGKASGLWQIIPITAEEMGLGRTDWFDGRADLINSTDAALDYLSSLNAQFDGDWSLTLAAYNAGPGRVRRAINRNLIREEPTDYWSLPLPQETRNYVPKLFSLLQMVEAQATANPIPGLDLPDVLEHPAFTEIDAGTRISIDRAASLAGLPERELRFLNAGWIHGITAPEGPHTLYMPTEHVDRFFKALAKSDKQGLVSLPGTHEVIAGDTLGAIAERYNTSSAQLIALNRLHGETIKVGQKLVVIASDLQQSPLEYVVSRGDSLSAIAARYSVELQDITTASGELPESHIIHPGQTLNITMPNAGQIAEAEPSIN